MTKQNGSKVTVARANTLARTRGEKIHVTRKVSAMLYIAGIVNNKRVERNRDGLVIRMGGAH